MTSLPLIDNCLFLDNSTIERITTCPTAADYYFIQRRELDSSAAPLRYGGIIHKAMEYRYRNQQSFDESEQLTLVTDLFNQSPIESEGWRNSDSASKLIRAYNRMYPETLPIAILPARIVKGKLLPSEPIIEMPFACYIGTIANVKIIYTGRIDLALQSDEGLFVMDFKTTSIMGDSFWKDQAMSEQHRGYCWALQESLGIEPTGYIVQALCTRESIVNAFFDDITGTVKPVKPNGKAVPVEFGRQRFFTKEPPGQLDEWRQNLLLQVETFLLQHARGSFARHHKHCVGKYGDCPYYHVCELPAKSRPTALASSAYRNVTWSPLKAQ
jgi:hypothetical protein